MSILTKVLQNILSTFFNPELYESRILAVLVMVTVLSLYEFVVYRMVSRRAFYNKSFNVSIAVIPYFISTIVLCLQTNLVITLGTIGALAIIRFRTAVKDPVDMVYLLWSVHIGIICGCQLYEVAVLTSAAVTVVLIILEFVPLGRKPYVAVCRCQKETQEQLLKALKDSTKNYRIKSRNFTNSGIDIVVEFSTKNVDLVTDKLSQCGLERFSVIEYDTEDVL